jgi:hypothetical protein
MATLNLPASTSGIWKAPAAGAVVATGAVVAAGWAGAVVAAGWAGACVAGAAAGAQAVTSIDNINTTAMNDHSFLDILLLLSGYLKRVMELKRSDRNLWAIDLLSVKDDDRRRVAGNKIDQRLRVDMRETLVN